MRTTLWTGRPYEERFGELFTEADEREAEEILAKPEEERQKIIDARVGVLLEKIAQKSGNKHRQAKGSQAIP